MSGFAHPISTVRLHRPQLVFLTVALVAAAVLLAVLALTSSGPFHSSHASAAPISATGGPNEAARGNAVSTASGASDSIVSGGPDESARGIAASTASGASGPIVSGGPNESARGIAAASASQP